jgi:hypothetical protein
MQLGSDGLKLLRIQSWIEMASRQAMCILPARSPARAMESRLKQSNQIYRILSDFAFDWEYWVSPDGNLVYISPQRNISPGTLLLNF